MDNSPISKDKLSFLNSLLDRELENLRNDSKSQPTQYEHEHTSFHQQSLRQLNAKSDLSDLQGKILDLEQKIQKRIEKVSDDDTPMKQKYEHQNSNKKKIQFNDKDKDTSRYYCKLKRHSPDQEEERQNKFKLEKSIESAENKLSQSKATLKKPSKSKSRDKSSRGNSGPQEKDAQIKLQNMRRQMEDDKLQLMREKQKNDLLLKQVEALNKKLKKYQAQIEKSSTIDQDYKRLQENFEKSEFIRQQQKTLIQSLKQEIEELKNKDDPKQKSKKKKKVLENSNR